MKNKQREEILEQPVLSHQVAKQKNHKLILFNDDVNTFDHVIECLINICQHSSEQAEQCAMIVHFNGKCNVQHGSLDKLKPKCSALLELGLSCSIE